MAKLISADFFLLDQFHQQHLPTQFGTAVTFIFFVDLVLLLPFVTKMGFSKGLDLDPPLDDLLPGGFLDQIGDRGLVVKTWAPQVAVLRHDSVGRFVTHCGWNLVLESICAGVPMVAWPLYAEQKFNKIMLVDELKLALPVNESENGLVSAEEVDKQVRELMETEQGNSVRDRVMAKKNEAVAALSNGGPILAALAQLVKCWAQN